MGILIRVFWAVGYTEAFEIRSLWEGRFILPTSNSENLVLVGFRAPGRVRTASCYIVTTITALIERRGLLHSGAT